MIDFLKESTFAVNEVISKAWQVTKRNYFSIATLCFLMFLTSNASNMMAFFLNNVSRGLSMLMATMFIVIYFTISLSLFRYIFHLLDDEEHDVSIVSTIPTRQQIIRFLIATFYFSLCIVVVGIIFYPLLLILDPLLKFLVSLGWVDDFTTTGTIVTNICVGMAIVAIFVTFVRISFFPFFIIDKNESPFRSIKFSLAITKGNFTKILLLLLVLGGFQLVYWFLGYMQWPIIAFFVNILSSFIIVPLSIVSLTIAYRKMMTEYTGDSEPDIIHNLI
ncbi:putative membrane protein [Pedobacter sp. UYP24]